MSILKNLVDRLVNLYKTEPVVVLSAVASAIVFLAANFGIVVNETSVLSALEYIVPILGLGVYARTKVTPV